MASIGDKDISTVYVCYLQLANALENIEKREHAGEVLGLAVQHFPNSPLLTLALGRWYLTAATADDTDITSINKSIELFTLAIKDAGNDNSVLSLAYENLGLAYRLDEQYEEAIDALEKAENLGQESVILWVALGDCLSRNGPAQNFNASLLALDKALERDPNSVDALRFKARVLRETKQFPQALECYDKALNKDRYNAVVLTGRAECFTMLGKPERALTDLNAALQLKRTFSLALVRRAGAKMALRHYKEALEDLCSVLDAEPGLPGARASRGLLYQLLGDYPQSLSDLDFAIKEKAHPLPVVLAYRGETYRLNGETDMAIADFDRAISLDNSCVVGYVGRGECYFHKKEYAKALKEFSKIFEFEKERGIVRQLLERVDPFPGSDCEYVDEGVLLPFVFSYRGETHRLRGDIDKALSDFTKVVSLDKRWVVGYAGLAECYYQKEEYAEALRELSEVLTLENNMPEALLKRADILYRFGDNKNGWADLDKIEEIVGNHPVAQMLRGRWMVEFNLLDDALKHFDQAIKSDGSLIIAIVCRAEVLTRLDKYQESLVELERALKIKPMNDWILYDKAMTFRKLGLADQVESTLKEAILLAEEKRSNRPKSYRTGFNLALYYLAASDQEKALSAYNESLESGAPSWLMREARRDVNSFISLFPNDDTVRKATGVILQKLDFCLR